MFLSKEEPSKRTSSGAGMGVFAVLIALAFIIGPFMLPFVSGTSRIILVSFGGILLVIGSTVVVVTRLYKKTSANWAFVRTGLGGRKAIIDGGAMVIPVVHEKVEVCLETMKLAVTRTGEDALITGDNLRADVHAEFFICVERTPESVLAAATSLGSKSGNPQAVQTLVSDKLISALRTVAGMKTLNELHTKRQEFASAVHDILMDDLRSNGLKLESVTISKLDQTPPDSMKGDSNIFDAQGLRTIAEITQAQRIERNRIERTADQEVKAQDVETDKFVYLQDVEREKAAAARDLEIKNAQARANQEAESFRAEQERLARLAQVEKEKAIGVADQARQKAVAEAKIEYNKAVEIADRDREIAVANKEREKATAEAERLAAEREKEAAAQAVLTTQVTAEAEREKAKAVIDEEAKAAQEKIKQNMAADVAAYRTEKEAAAKKTAARDEAEATVALAESEKRAKELKAQGEEAEKLVSVHVAEKQVEVDKRRVEEVLKPELQAKAENQQVAVELEIQKLKIQTQGEVGKAFAEALGTGLAASDLHIWGDPSAVAKITQAFTQGQVDGHYFTGLLESAPEKLVEAGENVVNAGIAGLTGIGQLGAGIIKKITGTDVDPAAVEKAVAQFIEKGTGGKK